MQWMLGYFSQDQRGGQINRPLLRGLGSQTLNPIKNLSLTFPGRRMSAVDFLRKTVEHSKKMRDSWSGLQRGMRNQQLQLLLHLGEIRSEGTLIFQHGGTAGFMKGDYIMRQICFGSQQSRFYTLTGHFDCVISLFGVDYKSGNNSHNEHNFLPNLQWTPGNSEECPRRYYWHNDMYNGGQLAVQ